MVEGSRYQPGQQLQVASPTGLNVRPEPSTGAPPVAGVTQGDYVAVLAGPVDAEGLEWWQVKTATNARGWIAGTINGFDTLRVP
ncbi:MAG: SH3 domain-containing protein [Chloroflexota bacterium]